MLLDYFDLCYDCTTWYLFLSAVSRHSSALSIFVFFLSCCCYNVNALLSFCEISCQTKQYSKGMGEGTCSSGYMWQNRTSYELFCNYVPVLSLFRGIIDVVLCVTFSQPAYTLITVSFCYSSSEPMLKQSSPNVIFPITNIPNFCSANTPKCTR